MKVESRFINGLKVFGFTKIQEIFKKIVEKPAILLAINAEKIYSNKSFLKNFQKVILHMLTELVLYLL